MLVGDEAEVVSAEDDTPRADGGPGVADGAPNRRGTPSGTGIMAQADLGDRQGDASPGDAGAGAGDDASRPGSVVVAVADGGLAPPGTDAGGAPTALETRPDAATCGTVLPIQRDVPDVMVVLDRSCSMARSVLGGTTFAADPNAKWNIAITALRAVLARYDGRVRWGALTFPSIAQGCATPGGGVDPRGLVEPQAMGASAVLRGLTGREVAPFDGCALDSQPHDTPLVRALEVAAAARAFRDPARAHHILLVTDGIETCDRSPLTTLTRRAQALRDMGVRTWVVGFGRNESAQQLDAIALAAGTARPSAPRYATARDVGSLEAALDGIAGAAADCSFSLREPPAAVSRLQVVGTGPGVVRSIPRDPARAEGWDYDPATRSITLFGAACGAVRAGTYSNLNITHDCPATRCVPQPEVCDNLDNDCDGVRDDGCAQP